jgi:hypothetical protein
MSQLPQASEARTTAPLKALLNSQPALDLRCIHSFCFFKFASGFLLLNGAVSSWMWQG